MLAMTLILDGEPFTTKVEEVRIIEVMVTSIVDGRAFTTEVDELRMVKVLVTVEARL